jgi:TonB-like protein
MCLAQSLPLHRPEPTVRCTNCEKDPLKAARYCECCGRELLPGQTSHDTAQASKAEPAADVDDWAPKPHRNSDLRCPSCGGPTLDGNRCAACRASDSPAGHAQSRRPIDQAAEIAEPEAVEQTGSIAPRASTASSSRQAVHVTAAHGGSPTAKEREATAPGKPIEPERPMAPAPPRRSAADAIYAEMLQRASSPTPPPRRPSVAPQTPATSERQQTPVAPERGQRPIVLASFGVLVAALVAGTYSIRSHEQPVMTRQQSPATIVAANDATDAGIAERPVPPVTAKPVSASSVPGRKPAPANEHAAASISASVNQKPAPSAPQKDSLATRSKATTPARSPRAAAVPAALPKPVRSQGPVREVPARVITSSPVVARPAVDVVETGRQPEAEAPAAAVGPVFELRDVSESPRIATQRPPKLPVELRSRAVKDVVVVRALVTQSGRPSRISLLRRSKTGPEMDDVILASVNQWTFSPARKKGEPVNCWFNFAVQVGGTD